MALLATVESWPATLPVVRNVHCDRCKRPVELACEGLGGIVMYETYNEYLCPHCGAQNHARTAGNIISALPGPLPR
jgi:predicted RNA-binding Zn-ribbon protein involved in translation (DUF1610 family)